ncbi:hypothetical protein Pla52n_38560 [Stieleria varia]|uniref:Uncharacterized protein n=1 Tax=Stieleria varia TaxID=2528005 RepID=A0A5C6ATL0_9BACT|nr:hypothetical protein Pla52n_38560 [Stieleria varia]
MRIGVGSYAVNPMLNSALYLFTTPQPAAKAEDMNWLCRITGR